MPTPQEPDFPLGHPARCDYNPASPEAQEWARRNIHPKGERDFPVGHPKALDTEGNRNAEAILPGVDPDRPDYEPFTGRSPEQAEAVRELYQQQGAYAKESPAVVPVMAADPPKSGEAQRVRKSADGQGYVIFCPGCKLEHVFDSRWQFNGSLTLPTFVPSMSFSHPPQVEQCHSYVTNGRIQFLSDSTHRLSGQTVDLPPISAAQETINA